MSVDMIKLPLPLAMNDIWLRLTEGSVEEHITMLIAVGRAEAVRRCLGNAVVHKFELLSIRLTLDDLNQCSETLRHPIQIFTIHLSYPRTTQPISSFFNTIAPMVTRLIG